ncbi:MAG: hypothetical protein JWL62_3759 [Hyphomicrobiales bacterium]|nr:hypothetical protein [Hyphomicrobiales bacterium]
MTFSIVARDAKTGELGAAVASAVPNSGRLALYLDAQLGAACIQGAVDEASDDLACGQGLVAARCAA